MDKNVIDDWNLENSRLSGLSDLQLAGFLCERHTLAQEVANAIPPELDKRGITPALLKELKATYLAQNLAPNSEKGSGFNLLYLFLLLPLFFTSLLVFSVGMVVIVVSLYAIRVRRNYGQSAGLNVWKKFQWLILSAFVILLGLVYLLKEHFV